MAIVRMKKLRLIVCRSQRDALMKELLLLGSVELCEQAEALTDEKTAALVTRASGDTAALRADKALLADGLKLLDKYAPQKSPLLSPKPQVTEAELLSGGGTDETLACSREITRLDEEIRNCYQEEAHRASQIEVLKPWRELELPIETDGTAHVALRLGTMPVMSDYDGLRAALAETLDSAEAEELSTDEHTRFLCVFFLREQETEAMEILRRYGFSVPAFGGLTGYARDGLERLEAELAALRTKREDMERQIAAFAPRREQLRLCFDRISVQETEADARERLLSAGGVVCLEGWSAEPQEQKLEEILQRYDCAYELTEPTEEEYPDVPVKLQNNRVTNALNMVTNMYSLPQYGTVDPNPLMAPFFILFYGIMMADMGYGLLMIIAALVVMKRLRPKEGTLSFTQLLLYCGITTFLMGALTGGFFGDAPLQVARLINPDTAWAGLPALFSPLNDSILVLGGALALGVIQLNTGMAVSFVQKLKHGDTLDAVLYEGALWVILIGGLLCGASALLKLEGLMKPGLAVAAVGALALFAGAVRGKKGFGIFTAIFSTLYNELTGWFGDILSYSRIMALMLAGSVIGQVFNTIGAMFGSVLLFIPIFLVGHALNMGLNILGCYVHDLRLQCLEYFGKFYTDGGKPFAPFRIRTKYVDVTK